MYRGGFNDSEMDYFSLGGCLRTGRSGVFHWHSHEDLTAESGRMKLGEGTMDNHRQKPRGDLHPLIGSLPLYRGFTAGAWVFFLFWMGCEIECRASGTRVCGLLVRSRPVVKNCPLSQSLGQNEIFLRLFGLAHHGRLSFHTGTGGLAIWHCSDG